MVCPSNFLYSILKINIKNDYVYYSPIICPITWTSRTPKSTVPFSLLTVWDAGTQNKSSAFLGSQKSPLNFMQDQAK